MIDRIYGYFMCRYSDYYTCIFCQHFFDNGFLCTLTREIDQQKLSDAEKNCNLKVVILKKICWNREWLVFKCLKGV
jgi:hypothetical protein